MKMKVLKVRNVHEALPLAIDMLYAYGIKRDSRNGPVLQYPYPVTTVYENPCERVLFWPERDANPFLHLYESLWMLAGRDDVKPLLQYAKNMINFSDDGIILDGAYGFRWRRFGEQDQLEIIADNLSKNQEDRRSVLQMWWADEDLGKASKDLPCNLIATFQRDNIGVLHLVVFNRSNDIIWGAYGANAVHFSFLLEYMAAWIGCPVGTYTQVSVNWHGYLNTLTPMLELYTKAQEGHVNNPYNHLNGIKHYPFPQDIHEIDLFLRDINDWVTRDGSFPLYKFDTPIFEIIYHTLAAHREYKIYGFEHAINKLNECELQKADWIVAAREWLDRRYARTNQK
jgi:thymidylate synthase